MNLNNLLKLSIQFKKTAEIVHRPRNIKIFLALIPKKLNEFKLLLNKLILPIKNLNDEDRISILVDFLGREISEFEIQHYPCFNFDEYLKRIKRDVEMILSENKINFKDWIEFIISNLKYFIEDMKKMLPQWQTAMSSRKYIESRNYLLEEETEKKYFKINYPSLEIINIVNLEKIPNIMEEIINYSESVVIKLTEYLRISSFYDYENDKARPKSEDIEVLYHATINAKQIASNGFSKNKGQEGLGGSNEDKSKKPAISFTSDFYIAKEIARCLRESILIAKGEIDWNDILEWSGEFKNKIEKSFWGIEGHISDEEKLNPKYIFRLYRIYLAYAESANKRYDPLFMGDPNELISILKNKNPNDVGIIAAKIDMTDPNILYLPSMNEYRVSPNSVISIDKAIFEGN